MSSRITAMDIERQEFQRRVRGYDADEVRLFLRSVAEEVERVNLDNAELREELGQTRRRAEEFGAREQTLQQTLLTAQSMSGELKERARAEAELLVRQARLNAERMLQQAQDQLARLEAEIGRCKLERDLFERRLRAILDEHLLLLEHRREDAAGAPDNLRVLPRRSASDAG